MLSTTLYTLCFFLMIRRPPRSTLDRSSAASDVYKRQDEEIVKQKFISKFDHNNEKASVGYYSVLLKDYNISSELTAALRSGLQKHTFKKDGKEFIQLDLAYSKNWDMPIAVSYTHLRAHETVLDLVCRLLLEKKKSTRTI